MENQNQKEEKKRSPRNPFLQFSGIAFQMGLTIFLGAYAGKYLDNKYQLEDKWFTISLTLFAVAAALFNIIRQLNRLNK